MTATGPPLLIGALKMSDRETLGFGGALEATDVEGAFADMEVAIEMTVVGNG